jgi:hypothetical protein
MTTALDYALAVGFLVLAMILFNLYTEQRKIRVALEHERAARFDLVDEMSALSREVEQRYRAAAQERRLNALARTEAAFGLSKRA